MAQENESGESQGTWDVEGLGAIGKRKAVLERLRRYEGRVEYGAEQASALDELGISIYSLRRLQRRYREEGEEGLRRRERSDAGERKVSAAWERFIVETYRAGNKGSRQMSCAQVARMVESQARTSGVEDYPSRRSVYRILSEEVKGAERRRKRHRIGWQGEQLRLTTKDGTALEITHSNQVWQCDHTPADILVVDSQGEYHRPTLTTVVDTYSRCIVGFHLGLEYPSADVTCLALRHGILAKQYGERYRLQNLWESYGVPQYLYTDGGRDFTSAHMEQVASGLGIVLCLRRKPSDGGIVERPFGTINRDFFGTLPGYTTNFLKPYRAQAESDACLSVEQVERLLVRYIVDNYNQQLDRRTAKESRMARWKSGSMAMGVPPEERSLDVLLMRQDRRRVYQGGYIRFANLVYRGEYLGGYAGEWVVLRYDPRDITTLYVYRQQGGNECFLTRAYALNLELERLSLSEAKAISRRLRQAHRGVTNQSVLEEVRERLAFVQSVEHQREGMQLSNSNAVGAMSPTGLERPNLDQPDEEVNAGNSEEMVVSKPLPVIRVYDYEQLRRGHGV